MDTIGWFIATLHNLVGHDTAQRMIGGPVYDKRTCLLCQYEAAPDDLKRQAVIRALTPREQADSSPPVRSLTSAP
jgi:hypothetical protein